MPRTQQALRLLRPTNGRGQAPQTVTRGPLPLLHRGGDRGEVHCHLKASARPVGSPGKGSGALEQPPDCSWTPPPSPSSHADQRPAELEGPMEKPKIHFLPHSLPEDHDSANSLLNGPTKGHSLTVGCL